MMNTWKANLDETKQHYINWWNHQGIVLNMWEHFQEGVTPHAEVPAPKPYRDLNQRWFDPEWRAEYLDWYVAHSSLMADILPVANTQLGPGSLAAILGGVFEGGEDTIWIHPRPVVDGSSADEIVFDPNASGSNVKAVVGQGQANDIAKIEFWFGNSENIRHNFYITPRTRTKLCSPFSKKPT